MTQDFADFLAALNSEGASYVVIGGMAVLFHIPYRTTRDIDVMIEPEISAWHSLAGWQGSYSQAWGGSSRSRGHRQTASPATRWRRKRAGQGMSIRLQDSPRSAEWKTPRLLAQ